MKRKNVNVTILTKDSCSLPEYACEGDSGMDLRAHFDDNEPKTKILHPGDVCLIKTGICVGLPDGYELQIRSRSGLALKWNVIVLNSPGTIDSGFRKEIGVILCNLGKQDFVVMEGDRIAQMVLIKVPKVKWLKVQSIDALSITGNNADRKGGFGHTGLN